MSTRSSDDWEKEVKGEVERDETRGAIVPSWGIKGFVLDLVANKGYLVENDIISLVF